MDFVLAPEERWAHVDWQTEDARHLRAALGFSLCLHAIALFVWHLPTPAWSSASGAPTLTVSLHSAALPAARTPLAAAGGAEGERRSTPMLVQERATLAVPPALTPGPPSRAVSAPTEKPSVPLPAGKAPLAPRTPPAAGAERPQPARPGGVTALLSIGEGGHVSQILWNQLPALSDEQLRRLEGLVRGRTYAGTLAGQTLNEVIDVRALLALPLPRAEPAAASVEPAQ